MKGVPVRLEIGPKDIENGQCVLVTRHNREKTIVKLDELEAAIENKLKKFTTDYIIRLLRIERTRHLNVRLLRKSSRLLKKKATASLKQCGAGEKLAKMLLRNRQE